MSAHNSLKKHIYSKVENNKNEKLNKLLDTAYDLFTNKGIKHTSIQEIVDHAGVAKGTFYLYFKDKYELQDYLLAITSYRLFEKALKACSTTQFDRLDSKIIFIINFIIDELINRTTLIHFIKKNLSLGLYSEKIPILIDDEQLGLKELFIQDVKKKGLNMPHPETTLFMIIELTGSTVFTSLMNKEPLPINEYKPILYNTIKRMINEDGDVCGC